MGIGPHHKQDRLLPGADNVLPLPEKSALDRQAKSSRLGDEFFDVLAPALEVAELPMDESPHDETSDLVLLLEENARLRKLAVQLSSLLGDLPLIPDDAEQQMSPSPCTQAELRRRPSRLREER